MYIVHGNFRIIYNISISHPWTGVSNEPIEKILLNTVKSRLILKIDYSKQSAMTANDQVRDILAKCMNIYH